MLAEIQTDYFLDDALEQLPDSLEAGSHICIQFHLASVDLLSWLKSQRSYPQLYWRNRSASCELAGTGKAIEFRAETAEQLDECFQTLDSYIKNHPQAHLLAAFVGMRFNAEEAASPEWTAFPAFSAIIPELLIRKQNESTHAVVCLQIKERDTAQKVVRRACRVLEKSFARQLTTAALCTKLQETAPEPDFEGFRASFAHVQQLLAEGAFSKVVLARREVAHLSERPDAVDVQAAMQEALGEGYSFFFSPQADQSFLCQSPECLFAIEGTRLRSDALGGSQLAEHSETDLDGAKLQREHEFVVQDLAAKFSSLASESVVRSEQQLVALPYISHLRTQFETELPVESRALEILQRLHPTPAVGTFPSADACQEIARIEAHPRGWYSGPVGVIQQDSAEFAVALRGLLLRGREATLYAGAGIVEGSTAENEWREIEGKLAPLISLFKPAKSALTKKQ